MREFTATIRHTGNGQYVLKFFENGEQRGSSTGTPWDGQPFTFDTALRAAIERMQEMRKAALMAAIEKNVD